MAVRIRLRRMGKNKRPFYRIVVADFREAADGKYIESIGYYDPLKEPPQIEIKEERLKEWISKGAKLTEPVEKLYKMRQKMNKKGQNF